MSKNLLEIKNLDVVYETKKSFLGETTQVRAVNDTSLDIKEGEILAIAGESGCGKSTLAKAIMKLVPVKNGQILFNDKNITNVKTSEDFYKNIQMVFQNPYASLNPKMKIGEILKEPLKINTKLSKEDILKTVEVKIKQVGLDTNSLNLYPHEFSGGQRQRIAIARALILSPKFIIADEPVSALDVSIQAQIINLLKQLKDDCNLTILFISHDLSVIKYLSDRIAIMYLGEIVEIGTTDEIFNNPKHPYTQALLSAAPELNNNTNKKKIVLSGELPSPENLPTGCKFHTRCPYVMDICKNEIPQVENFSPQHNCKCFLYKYEH